MPFGIFFTIMMPFEIVFFSVVSGLDFPVYGCCPTPQTWFCQNCILLILHTWFSCCKPAASLYICQGSFVFMLPQLPWFLPSLAWKGSLRPPSMPMAEQRLGVQFLFVQLQYSIHLNHAISNKATVVYGRCWLLGWQLLAALRHHGEFEGIKFMCKFGPSQWTLETEGTMSWAVHVYLAGCPWPLWWHPQENMCKLSLFFS